MDAGAGVCALDEVKEGYGKAPANGNAIDHVVQGAGPTGWIFYKRRTLMKSCLPLVAITPGGRSSIWLLLLALLLANNIWAADPPLPYQDIDLKKCTPVRKYNAKSGIAIPVADQKIFAHGSTNNGNVFWGVDSLSGGCTQPTATTVSCLGSSVVVTIPAGSAALVTPATMIGTPNMGTNNSFGLIVTDVADVNVTCTQTYNLRGTSDGGGWGDPHITTVDGVDYDFQSAGEFIALRDGGIEIQTRQTPVPTTSIPGANAYTGLASCVSIYTAIAARVGKHRVSYQQSSTNAEVMELRVDGKLVNLGAEGINLESKPIIARPPGGVVIPNPGSIHPEPIVAHPPVGVVTPKIDGRIVKAATGDGIEIHYTDGTKVVVTQSWWSSQQMWYLNVDAFETTATEGVMGRIAKGSWLPALADGSSVGPKPSSVHDRYTALYEKFADSWRLTDSTSLFDYEPGTSTKSFTLADWPRESPTSCAIGGQQSVKPVSAAVANKQCSAIVDKKAKANCVFDVAATGYNGFAKTYLIQEKLRGVTPISTKPIERLTRTGERVTLIVSRSPRYPTRLVQFIVDGKNFGDPVRFDASGQAVLSTSNLPAGKHRIEKKYIVPSSLEKPSLPGTRPAIDQAVVPEQPIKK